VGLASFFSVNAKDCFSKAKEEFIVNTTNVTEVIYLSQEIQGVPHCKEENTKLII